MTPTVLQAIRDEAKNQNLTEDDIIHLGRTNAQQQQKLHLNESKEMYVETVGKRFVLISAALLN